MKTVWKHEISTDDMRLVIKGPGLRPLHVDVIDQHVFVWVERDENKAVRDVEIQIFGTGHQIPEDFYNYAGSFTLLDGEFVGHVYARQVG